MAALPVDSQRFPVAKKPNFLNATANRWQAFNPREKTLVGTAMAVVAAALLWWVAVAPALGVLNTAQTQRGALQAQLQQMQNLQAQAKALQTLPKIKSADAARALEALTRQNLGAAAQLSIVGNQATLTLTSATADALAQFLTQARLAANALPSQARLRRSTGKPQAWDGTMVLSLPAP